MGITLLRANGEAQITNDIDCRIFRYAVGGYNGVLKGYKNECSYSVSGNTFTIAAGEIVIDGWQIGVDSAGVAIVANNVSQLLHYTVYVKIDLSMVDRQTAEILAVYDASDCPTIEKGDDLTANSSGIANLPLYHFDCESGEIRGVVRLFDFVEIGKMPFSQSSDSARYSEMAGAAESAINATNAKHADHATTADNATATDFSLAEWRTGVLSQTLLKYGCNYEIKKAIGGNFDGTWIHAFISIPDISEIGMHFYPKISVEFLTLKAEFYLRVYIDNSSDMNGVRLDLFSDTSENFINTEFQYREIR